MRCSELCSNGVAFAYCPNGHSGPCPCDPEVILCSHCKGTGTEPCAYCGSPVLGEVTDTLQTRGRDVFYDDPWCGNCDVPIDIFIAQTFTERE